MDGGQISLGGVGKPFWGVHPQKGFLTPPREIFHPPKKKQKKNENKFKCSLG